MKKRAFNRDDISTLLETALKDQDPAADSRLKIRDATAAREAVQLAKELAVGSLGEPPQFPELAPQFTASSEEFLKCLDILSEYR